jgi:glutamate-1-semialdehyde 2,1-aminomutase
MLATLGLEEIAGVSFLCGGNEKLQRVLEEVVARQRKSVAMQQLARQSLSGSPSLLPYESPILPICVERAAGSRVTDIDGNEYLDCHMAYTASILGHNPVAVRQAVEAALNRGLGGGQLFAEQVELAELVRAIVPGVERVALFHTGGEAVQAGLRVARAIRGKQRIAKFEGCYHGSQDLLLHNTWMILAGKVSKDPVEQIRPQPDTGGVRPASADEMLILPFNSPAALALVEQHSESLACVLVDPVPSFMTNWLTESRQFLGELCRICTANDVPVVFDEVVCGFRLALGGARQWSGHTPQLSCFGKITSGLGIPLSILAGEARFVDAACSAGFLRDYMMRKSWLSSTLQCSFLPVVAALAQLRYLTEHYDAIVDRLDQNETHLRQRLRDFAERSGIPVNLEGCSRLQMQLSVGKSSPPEKTYRGMMSTASPAQLRALLALTFYLRLRGVYAKTIPSMNLSAAHTEEDIAYLADAIESSLRQMELDGVISA